MSHTEHEAKLPVTDLAPVRERLQAAGAEPRGTAEQHDTLYDFADGRLRAQEAALRLRRTDAGATLTYKGPPQGGPFKLRTEHESIVADPDAVARVLEALGCVVTLSYRKTRELWRLHDCDICLDTIPQLGTFVEIEGPDAAAITAAAAALALDTRTHESQSYPQLLDAHASRSSL